MGYTHYQYQLRDFTDAEWKKICSETQRILETAKADGIEIGDWQGDRAEPEVSGTRIAFNGVGNDSHETYSLEREQPPCPEWDTPEEYARKGAFNCCKTALKPYDPVVVSVMAMVKEVAPSAVSISSDGGSEVFTEDAKYW